MLADDWREERRKKKIRRHDHKFINITFVNILFILCTCVSYPIKLSSELCQLSSSFPSGLSWIRWRCTALTMTMESSTRHLAETGRCKNLIYVQCKSTFKQPEIWPQQGPDIVRYNNRESKDRMRYNNLSIRTSFCDCPFSKGSPEHFGTFILEPWKLKMTWVIWLDSLDSHISEDP